MGLRVIMDLIHSHAVSNTLKDWHLLDGDPGLYFHKGARKPCGMGLTLLRLW